MTEQREIADALGETEPQPIALIGRIVRRLGAERTAAIVEETRKIEAGGGMLTRDGRRRRTPGGVFFELVKRDLRTAGDEATLTALFPPRPVKSKQRVEHRGHPQAHVVPPVGVPPVGVPLRPRMRRRPDLSPPAAPPRRTSNIAPDRPSNDIGAILVRHLGDAPEFYRRSVDPQTGAATLAAYFPAIARQRYAAAVEAAAAEAGVPITISAQPHQGRIAAAARAVLPEGVTPIKTAVRVEQEMVELQCGGVASEDVLAAAAARFAEETGWQLRLILDPEAEAPQRETVDGHGALTIAWQHLPSTSGCYAIGARDAERRLVVRFNFPDIARVEQATALEAIAAATGWGVDVHPEPHQGQLATAAHAALPAGAEALGTPSLRFRMRQVVVRYHGVVDAADTAAAHAAFLAQTGWELVLKYE